MREVAKWNEPSWIVSSRTVTAARILRSVMPALFLKIAVLLSGFLIAVVAFSAIGHISPVSLLSGSVALGLAGIVLFVIVFHVSAILGVLLPYTVICDNTRIAITRLGVEIQYNRILDFKVTDILERKRLSIVISGTTLEVGISEDIPPEVLSLLIRTLEKSISESRCNASLATELP